MEHLGPIPPYPYKPFINLYYNKDEILRETSQILDIFAIRFRIQKILHSSSFKLVLIARLGLGGFSLVKS